jgi:hypothetical protein
MNIQRNTWGNAYIMGELILLCSRKNNRFYQGDAWVGWSDRNVSATISRRDAARLLIEERAKQRRAK